MMENTRRLLTALGTVSLLALVVLIGTSTSTHAAGTADLSVTKTASRQTAVVGRPLIYTVTVTNHGPDTATGVTLTDFFQVNSGVAPGEPRNYRFLWARTTQGDCDKSDAEGNITCRLGDLANGATVSARIGVIPLESGTIRNTARAYSEAFSDDPNLNNNEAAVITPICC